MDQRKKVVNTEEQERMVNPEDLPDQEDAESIEPIRKTGIDQQSAKSGSPEGENEMEGRAQNEDVKPKILKEKSRTRN
jgi:hypothetical protein